MSPSESRSLERSRALTLYVSLIALAANAACAIALQLLPSNTSPLAFNFSLYSLCGVVISLLGFFGALKGYPSLLTIFSNHLLLDALISTIPRLLLLPVFSSLPTTFCSFFDPRHPILQPYADASSVVVAAGGPASQQQQQQQPFVTDPWVLQRCRALTWLALAISGVTMVCLTVMQWVCAWRVREYARYLESREQQQQQQQASAGCLVKDKVDDDRAAAPDLEKGAWES